LQISFERLADDFLQRRDRSRALGPAIHMEPRPSFTVPSRTRPSHAALVRVLILALVVPHSLPRAQAQNDGSQPTQPQTPTITPPRLVEAADAVLPAEFEATGVDAALDLLVTIGADGSVVDVTAEAPIGRGLDEAAIDAVRRSTFEPARRGDVAIATRIRFRFTFQLRERPPSEPLAPNPAEPAAPEPGRVSGRILGDHDRPSVDALVVVVDERGVEREVRTDAEGAFLFDGIPPGVCRIDVFAADGSATSSNEVVESGIDVNVVLRVRARESADADAEFGARAVVDPPPREVTRRSIPREVLTRVPGTRGDALRTIELMPGVARPPFGAGVLLVRGSSPADSEVMLDGAPVPLLYHFGGLTSFIPSRFLERIDFYPGNYSSRYGRRTGGIVDVATRDPASDRTHAVLEVSAIDASAIVEGPIGRHASYAIGARRSLIDVVFRSFLSGNGSVQITSAPVYYDYQAFLSYRPTPRDRLKFAFYGASDGIRLLFGDEGQDTPDLQGRARIALRFNFAQVSWDRRVGERTDQRITFQVGPHHIDTQLGSEYQLGVDLIQTFGRAEWTTPIGSHLRLVTGVDVFAFPYDFQYRGNPPIASEGQTGEDVAGARLDVGGDGFIARPGAYADLGISVGDLYVNLGQRVDYFGDIGRFSYDPRIAARYQVSRTVRLRGGVGLYSQPPEYQESIKGLGNPNLSAIRSLHTSAGIDVTPTTGVEVSVEGFYKYLWDRVVPTEDGGAPRFRSAGVGRIYGGELSVRANPSDARFFGYLSYTLMRSERRDPEETRYRLFDFDQTHILTASAGYRLPHHWEIGATFRLASGNPYTQTVGSIHDLSRPAYIPVHDERNGARSPYFHRLDVRVEKQWWWDGFRLALFLDVQNAYNHANQEGLAYSYDYRRSAPLQGLPIFPSIGLRGEL